MKRPDFEGAKYVFTPPLREKKNQPKLWDGLKNDHLQVVSTDHCPFCFEDQKVLGKDDFTKIPNGGPGIENRLQLIHHYGVNAGKLTLNRFVEIISTAPARIFGMYPKKGEIAPGSDADIVIWDPKAEHIISAKTHHMRVRLLHVRRLPGEGQCAAGILARRVIVERRQVPRQAGPRPISARALARGGAWTVAELRPKNAGAIARSTTKTSRRFPWNSRTWGIYNYASLWVAMSVCIPTYMLASGLIAGGMSWKQAIGTILLGNLIVLDPDAAERARGHEVWHSVSGPRARVVRSARRECSRRAARAGGLRMVRHSNLDRRPGHLLHAADPVAAGGFQHVGRSGSASSRSWLLNMLVIWRGIETIKFLEGIGAPFMLAVGLLLAVVDHAQSRRPRAGAERAEQVSNYGRVLRFFIPSLTGMVGFWATVALNIPDFTRYAKSQKAQMVGQALGLARRDDALFVHRRRGDFGFGGAVSARPIWDPVALLGRFNQPLVASIALIALLVATLNTNVAANVVSPSNDFSNLNPRLISFRTGGLITGVVGVLMMPWKLLTDFKSYIFGWLVGYSGLLGPIAGVMIADYFLLRHTNLDVGELYNPAGDLSLRERRQLPGHRRAGGRYRCRAYGAGGAAASLAV